MGAGILIGVITGMTEAGDLLSPIDGSIYLFGYKQSNVMHICASFGLSLFSNCALMCALFHQSSYHQNLEA